MLLYTDVSAYFHKKETHYTILCCTSGHRTVKTIFFYYAASDCNRFLFSIQIVKRGNIFRTAASVVKASFGFFKYRQALISLSSVVHMRNTLELDLVIQFHGRVVVIRYLLF